MYRTIILSLLLVFSTSLVYAQDEQDAAIHDELRSILKQVESAINSGNYDAMLPVLSKNLRITPINQEFLQSHQEVSEYFQKWFGEGGYLKKLEISLTPDVQTELSNDKTWGLVYGQGRERYILADGRKFDMTTRWTATVVKEKDEHWRIRSIHIGTNFLDNPVLAAVEKSTTYLAMAGLLLGLLLGSGLAWFFLRRK